MSSEPEDILAARIRHLLSSGNGADVHFLVGKEGAQKEVVPAHKTILLAASDVFAAMFRFDAQNAKAKNASSDEVIHSVQVIDVSPAVFKAMLSFIYADDLSGLNGANAMALLYTAKKYNIRGLIKACLEFPIPKLYNIFHAFAYARRILGGEDFARRCSLHIDQNANTLLQSEAFLKIDQHLLGEILGSDLLDISGGEIGIWNTALRWADAQCRQNGTECTGANRRAALGSALYKIRIRLIPAGDFTKMIAPSGVLTDQEVIGVYMAHHHTQSDVRAQPSALYPLRFPAERRVPQSVLAVDVCDNSQFKGRLMLKITEFYDFAYVHTAVRFSDSVLQIGGFEWSIRASAETDSDTGEDCLGFFIQCDPRANAVAANWRVGCTATLRIVSRWNGMEDFCRTLSSYVLSDPTMSICWGHNNFMTLKYLMDEQNGLYRKDTVTLRVDITADEPE